MNVGAIPKFVSRLLFDPKLTEVTTESIKAARKSGGYFSLRPKHFQDAFKQGYRESIKESPSLWNAMKKSLTTLPKDMNSMWKSTSGIWGKTKGVFSQLGKRMPLIGGILMVGFELPNIFSAFKDKGFIGGVKEIFKSGSKLVGGMAGAAIGQALIPIPLVGGLIGWVAGEKLVSLVVGKSHTEKKEEALLAQEKATDNAEGLLRQLEQQNPNAQQYQYSYADMKPTVTPQQLMYMRNILYGGGMTDPMNQDFMKMTSGIGRLNYNA